MTLIKSALTDADIVRLVRLKGRAGAEALYDRYAKALFVAIIRMIPQKEGAEDLLEKAFIDIWNSFDQYRAQKEKLFTWMVKLAREKAKEVILANKK